MKQTLSHFRSTTKSLVAALIPTLCLTSLSSAVPDFKVSLGKVALKSRFESETMSIWGGSLVKGPEGKYHMLYARWPKKLGWVWVTHSDISHASSDSPFGPFTHQSVALPVRDKKHWDGLCTHNPTVHQFDGKYYLYYMGNTGDGKVVGKPGAHKLNWGHRNNQRIGVAVADHPAGPWVRSDKPVLDISPDEDAVDSLMVSNPSVCRRPDGTYLMIYKAVGKKFKLPAGGPVVHAVATSESPTGPFKKYGKPIFTHGEERFPAEDPYVWFEDGKYRAIVKRIKFKGGKRLFSLVHYDSMDGLDWKPAKHHHITERVVTWEDGTVQTFDHLERPQLYIEDGKPIALLCATDTIDENNVRQSFNMQIPIIITKSSE